MNPSLASILDGTDSSLRARLIRTALVPLEALHRVGLGLYLLPFHCGLRQRHRLPVPVISIGNLVSGGTGKTPTTIAVAQLLCELGCKPVVLSRGHGGSHENAADKFRPLVVSDRSGALRCGPDEAGDEPVLMARALPGVPVVVGRDRRITGRFAVEQFDPDVLLLDDGLQFWQLHRDLDICLLDTRRPFDNGRLIPRGLLREPAFHLRRAGAVVLTRHDRADAAQRTFARQQAGRLAPQALVVAGNHGPVGWVDRGANLHPPDFAAGKRVRVVTGIADGNGFVETVAGLGADIVDTCIHPDHHRFTDDDLRAARQPGVDAVATTEKDWVKLEARWPVDAPAVLVLRIAMQFDNPSPLREKLATVVGRD